MQLEVGTILEGKVTGITKFGAFVELPGNRTGMVHISEVAPTYVKEIRDFVSEDQVVKVKVLSISEDGKISLSIKKAMEGQQQPQAARSPAPEGRRGGNRRPFTPRPQADRPGNFEWQSTVRSSDSGNFEDMMSRFKQSSDEKMTDIKRAMDSKRGSFIKRGGGGGR